MGERITPLLGAGILVLALSLAGCANERVERLQVEPANPFQGPITPLEGGVARTPIGQEAEAGPYRVRLTTQEEPAVGPARFTARVTLNGKPAGDMMVSLALSRSSMEASPPSVNLRRTAPGTYTGTTSIPEEGAWLAQLTVVGQQGTSNAFYALSTDGTQAGLHPTESANTVQTGAGPIEPLPDTPGTWGNGQFGRE